MLVRYFYDNMYWFYDMGNNFFPLKGMHLVGWRMVIPVRNMNTWSHVSSALFKYQININKTYDNHEQSSKIIIIAVN